ncbi:MAG: hypothetical protein QN168_02560 [Armatimonadota bacterium]|nr:hypothetical protein [Armatimonadota bacterium]
MLIRREHRAVLSEQRRAAGQAVHRDALAAERSRRQWERVRLALARSGHRAVLRAERDQLHAARREHKRALQQNRWLLALAELLEARRGRAA